MSRNVSLASIDSMSPPAGKLSINVCSRVFINQSINQSVSQSVSALLLARHSLSIEHERKHSWYRLSHLSVRLSLPVQKVYYGKTADWIQMSLGVVSGVGRQMGVLDGGGNHQREWTVLG